MRYLDLNLSNFDKIPKNVSLIALRVYWFQGGPQNFNVSLYTVTEKGGRGKGYALLILHEAWSFCFLILFCGPREELTFVISYTPLLLRFPL